MTFTSVQHEEARYCHNCSAAVTYHYCALCGQETTLHVPSASEFIHEFVGHYVALEGRLWKTLAYLLLKPGLLTAEYIAGRRVRYVQPLRVYLSLSILFFALLKVAGPPMASFDDERPAAKPGALSMSVTPGQIQPKAVAGAGTTGAGSTPDDPIRITFAPGLSAKLNKFMEKPVSERVSLLSNAFFSYVPYVLFCLMPLFALYLKLLYLGSGRRYGEHLLFALHANAFAFAMISFIFIISPLDWGLPTFVLVVWLMAYLPMAMRRVYGGSRLTTGLRWLVLSGLHIASIAAAILGAFAMAVMG